MKHLLSITVALLALSPIAAQAQVGVGTTSPDAKSALDIRATDKGLLIPRLTATQRTAITSPPQGLMVYQTDGTASGGPQTGFWYYAGTSGWVFLDAGTSSGLTLPYSGSTANSSAAFAVANTGAGQALSGTATGTTAAAVQGDNTNSTSGSGTGVLGTTVSGYGVRGTASGTNGYGVAGSATDSRGVSGNSVSGPGLYGRSTSGISAQAQKAGSDLGRVAEFTNTNASNDSTTLYVSTPGDRPALRAVNTATSAQPAIRGVKQSASTDGSGVEGVVTSGATGNAAGVRGLDQSGSGSGSGVVGLTASGYGVRGIASASGGYGVQGVATDSYGLIGTSTSGVGAQGTSTSNFGVRGNSNSSNGVYGTSSSNSGVYGTTAAGTAGGVAGVEGNSSNSSGIGVLGTTSSGYGVRGEATGSSGFGVSGTATGSNGYALIGSATGAANGLYATSNGTGRTAYFNQTGSSGTANVLEVQNVSAGRTAFFNQSSTGSTANALEINLAGSGHALHISHSIARNSVGLFVDDQASTTYSYLCADRLLVLNPNGGGTGVVLNANSGVVSQTFNSPAITAISAASGALAATLVVTNTFGKAAIFNGPVDVTGSLSKGGGSFKIDHPLDPENQYLYHSFVESPDMMNVYNGNITLDANGEATVQLPDWFEALNRDFRYQLTPIGAAFTPYIKKKVAGNKFCIAGQPGAEVSWQVTGIRHDKWADAHRIPTEQAKEPENQGKYLYPKEFGKSETLGIYTQPTKLAAPKATTPPANSAH